MSSIVQKLKGGALLSLMMLTTQVINFVIVNFIAKKIGLEGFGQFSILLQDFNWFSFLRDFGMSQILIAWYQQQKTSAQAKSQAFLTTGAMSLLSGFLFFIYILVVRDEHPNQSLMWWFLLGIVFNPSTFDWYFLSTKQWMKLFLVRLTQVGIYSGIAFLLLNSDSTTTIGMLVEILNYSLVIAFILGTLLFKPWDLVPTSWWSPFKSIIHQSFPMALSGLLGFFYLQFGFFIIDWFHPGEPIVAIYNTSHRLIMIASMMMVNFITSGLVFSSGSSHPSLRESLIQGMVLWLPIFLSCFFAGQWILTTLFFGIQWQAQDLEWAHFNLYVLTLSILFQALRNNIITWLIQSKQTWTYLKLLSIGALLNIFICTALIHNDLSQWIAPGVLIADLFLSLSLIIYARRYPQAT